MKKSSSSTKQSQSSSLFKSSFQPSRSITKPSSSTLSHRLDSSLSRSAAISARSSIHSSFPSHISTFARHTSQSSIGTNHQLSHATSKLKPSSLLPFHWTSNTSSISTTSRAKQPTSSTPRLFSSFPSLFSQQSNPTNTSSLSVSSMKSHRRVQLPAQRRSMSTELHEEVGVTPPQANEDTIFGKMTRGEINVPKVYEDDKCIVIDDINPQAPVHMLVIPRKPIQQLSKSDDDDAALLGHLLSTARKVAKERQLDDGFRTVINDGVHGAQSVYHLHIHVLGGKKLSGRFD